MPEARRFFTDKHDNPDSGAAHPQAPDYRARASSLHRWAEQSRFSEARESLDGVARWYEILADYAERWRKPATR